MTTTATPANSIPTKGSTVCLKRGVESIRVTDALAIAGTGEVDAVVTLDDGRVLFNIWVRPRGEALRRLYMMIPADMLEVANL